MALLFSPLTGSASVNPLFYPHATVKISSDHQSFYASTDLADTFRRRVFGMMHRTYLPKDHGMLFTGQTFDSIWMKDTLIPLDILFVDHRGMILRIVERALPCVSEHCRTYAAPKETAYILEFNAGWARTYSVSERDIIELL